MATKTTKTTKKNEGGLPFASLARTRVVGSGAGGRYAVKTRRLTLPAEWGGKSVDASVVDGVLIIGGEGAFSCHPSQHFITLPKGVVEASENLTLTPAEVPGEVGVEAIAYRLPS